jgi:NitT/TauT family transport system ATP-binding protein
LGTDILEFRDVTIRFGGETIYKDLSFAVRPGEFLCILGPSGCGKSTSLRVMGDLLAVDEGTVTVEGEPAHRGWAKLAYVFQQPRLAPWRTALGNVMLGMELRFDHTSKAARTEKARELLDMVGLGKDVEKYPSMLSGGERQRVSIARALSVDPHIILMDEPFSALDLNTRRRLRAEIISIWKNTGKTVIFVTHDIEEALVLADRVLLLSDKPTRVLETLEIETPRPRDVESTAELRKHKDHLIALFRTLEKKGAHKVEDETQDPDEETAKNELSHTTVPQ